MKGHDGAVTDVEPWEEDGPWVEPAAHLANDAVYPRVGQDLDVVTTAAEHERSAKALSHHEFIRAREELSYRIERQARTLGLGVPEGQSMFSLAVNADRELMAEAVDDLVPDACRLELETIYDEEDGRYLESFTLTDGIDREIALDAQTQQSLHERLHDASSWASDDGASTHRLDLERMRKQWRGRDEDAVTIAAANTEEAARRLAATWDELTAPA